MLRVHRLPGSLLELLEEFRPCFIAPTFRRYMSHVGTQIIYSAGTCVLLRHTSPNLIYAGDGSEVPG